MEARDASIKKQEGDEKKLTTQEQTCKNCCRLGETHVHKDIYEGKLFMNLNKKSGRPPWDIKKLKILGLKSKLTNDYMWYQVEGSTYNGRI